MKVSTYSDARQRLASLLNESRREGQVQIRRRDGQLFVLQPVGAPGSPLDVPAVQVGLRPGERDDLLRASRERVDRFWGDLQPETRTRSKRPKRRRRT